MKSNEWVKILENEVEKRFDASQVNGFEDSAPALKLAILAEMYDNEPMNIEIGKELAYNILANKYDVQSSWN